METVVLITGADGGLGGAVTDRFLQGGATVFTVSRKAAPAEHPRRFAVQADLTSGEDAKAAVQAALDQAGRLDVLVHLVGGFAGGSRVEETDDATWNGMISLNLNAAFHIMRAALVPMRAARRGRVIAVGSRTGLDLAAGYGAYGVSKAALHALVKTVALENRNHKITANVVMPSVIDTPANRAAMPDADHAKWVAPSSLASVIHWLASDEAAEVSGALIPAYGRA
ncbi:MAG: SDR family oxidoreductase [Armatimonadetes bacterium]|nr:SDR family oxidoreductase [Armatimonadota bacterium]